MANIVSAASTHQLSEHPPVLTLDVCDQSSSLVASSEDEFSAVQNDLASSYGQLSPRSKRIRDTHKEAESDQSGENIRISDSREEKHDDDAFPIKVRILTSEHYENTVKALTEERDRLRLQLLELRDRDTMSDFYQVQVARLEDDHRNELDLVKADHRTMIQNLSVELSAAQDILITVKEELSKTKDALLAKENEVLIAKAATEEERTRHLEDSQRVEQEIFQLFKDMTERQTRFDEISAQKLRRLEEEQEKSQKNEAIIGELRAQLAVSNHDQTEAIRLESELLFLKRVHQEQTLKLMADNSSKLEEISCEHDLALREGQRLLKAEVEGLQKVLQTKKATIGLLESTKRAMELYIVDQAHTFAAQAREATAQLENLQKQCEVLSKAVSEKDDYLAQEEAMVQALRDALDSTDHEKDNAADVVSNNANNETSIRMSKGKLSSIFAALPITTRRRDGQSLGTTSTENSSQAPGRDVSPLQSPLPIIESATRGVRFNPLVTSFKSNSLQSRTSATQRMVGSSSSRHHDRSNSGNMANQGGSLSFPLLQPRRATTAGAHSHNADISTRTALGNTTLERNCRPVTPPRRPLPNVDQQVPATPSSRRHDNATGNSATIQDEGVQALVQGIHVMISEICQLRQDLNATHTPRGTRVTQDHVLDQNKMQRDIRNFQKQLFGITKDAEIVEAVQERDHFVTKEESEVLVQAMRDGHALDIDPLRPYWDDLSSEYNQLLGNAFTDAFVTDNPVYEAYRDDVSTRFNQRLATLKAMLVQSLTGIDNLEE